MAANTRGTRPGYTVPGMKPDEAGELITLLQGRLNALNDLALTLKHVHWNVVGRISSRCTRCWTRRSMRFA